MATVSGDANIHRCLSARPLELLELPNSGLCKALDPTLRDTVLRPRNGAAEGRAEGDRHTWAEHKEVKG